MYPSSTTARVAQTTPSNSLAQASTKSRHPSAPRPAPTRMFAFVISTPSTIFSTTLSMVTSGSVVSHFGANDTTSPVRLASTGAISNTFGEL